MRRAVRANGETPINLSGEFLVHCATGGVGGAGRTLANLQEGARDPPLLSGPVPRHFLGPFPVAPIFPAPGTGNMCRNLSTPALTS